MAECTIGEYPGGPPIGSQAIDESTLLTTPQVLGVTGVAATSQPFTGDTKTVRIWTDTKMAWRFGKAGQTPPVAVVTDQGMSAGGTEYFVAHAGDYFSVILLP